MGKPVQSLPCEKNGWVFFGSHPPKWTEPKKRGAKPNNLAGAVKIRKFAEPELSKLSNHGRVWGGRGVKVWPLVGPWWPKVPGQPKRDPSFDNPTKQCKSLKFVKSVNRLQRPRKVNTPRRGVTYNTTVCYVCWLVLTLETTKIPVRRFLFSLTVTRANNCKPARKNGKRGPVRADSQTAIWGLRECTSRWIRWDLFVHIAVLSVVCLGYVQAAFFCAAPTHFLVS